MREDCSKVNMCSAPLCPLDEESWEAVWYPGEEICTLKSGVPGWVKRQRKIVRKLGVETDGEPRFDLGYFTKEMLEVNFRITHAIRGLNPNKEEGPQLKKWLEKRPGVKKLSEEQRAELRERLKKARKAKDG